MSGETFNNLERPQDVSLLPDYDMYIVKKDIISGQDG